MVLMAGIEFDAGSRCPLVSLETLMQLYQWAGTKTSYSNLHFNLFRGGDYLRLMIP